MSLDEPMPVAAGLARARQALVEAGGQPRRDPAMAEAWGEDAEEIAAAQARSLETMREVRWHSLVPQRFHRAHLEDLEADARRQIEEWRTYAPRPNLVLFGPVGTGKTHAAIAAVREDWMTVGVDFRFLPTTELLDMLRPGGDPHALDDVIEVPRLVLDDLGHERATDWTGERLGAVINRRWMEERPVIATTNLSASELREAVGDRTYSRLIGSDAVVVSLAGDDRRKEPRRRSA